jgi:hypothetical protein
VYHQQARGGSLSRSRLWDLDDPFHGNKVKVVGAACFYPRSHFRFKNHYVKQARDASQALGMGFGCSLLDWLLEWVLVAPCLTDRQSPPFFLSIRDGQFGHLEGRPSLLERGSDGVVFANLTSRRAALPFSIFHTPGIFVGQDVHSIVMTYRWPWP